MEHQKVVINLLILHIYFEKEMFRSGLWQTIAAYDPRRFLKII